MRAPARTRTTGASGPCCGAEGPRSERGAPALGNGSSDRLRRPRSRLPHDPATRPRWPVDPRNSRSWRKRDGGAWVDGTGDTSSTSRPAPSSWRASWLPGPASVSSSEPASVLPFVARRDLRIAEQLIESGPTGLDHFVGARALPEVAVATASWAQPQTVGRAQRGEGHRQDHGVPDHLLRVQRQVLCEPVVILRTGSDGEQLVHLDVEGLRELLQAPSAPHGHRAPDGPGRIHPLDHALQCEVAGEPLVTGNLGQLHVQSLDGLVHAHRLGRAWAPDQVADVDRAHHPPSSSSSSSGPTSCWAGAAPRRRSRPPSTCSRVRPSAVLVAASSSLLLCSAISNWASLAST